MSSASPSETVALSPNGDELRVRRFWLKVVAGKDEGKIVVSSGEKMVIGSHESADLVLQDEAVSRFHCEIDVRAGRPVLRDLESRNGTLLDGVSVLAAIPKDGALLSVGRTKVRFELRTEESR
ncbi:MAG: FHA domain-containing protein, partial [Myxococcales bacterium]|nr:FHA domain-containing protein [Myxococcales bacterium]